MIRRDRRRDKAPFWGCSRFPACYGTRPLEAIETVRPVQPSAPLAGAIPWDDPSWRSRSTAGASARATGERRAARHRARVRAARPRISLRGVALAVGGIALVFVPGGSWSPLGWALIAVAILGTLTRLFVLPDHIRAWTIGAEGEERVARLLDELQADGYVVLSDLLIPGSRENIDHVVVGPTGVFVVETKNYSGLVKARGRDLYVGRRRKTEFIDQAERQVAAVRRVVGEVDLTAYLAFVRAEFPFFGRQRVRGIEAVPAGRLLRQIRQRPARLDATEVESISTALAAALLPSAPARLPQA